MKIPAALTNLLPALLVAALLIGYDHFVRARATPTVSPLAAAAKQYRDTLPDAFKSIRDQITTGQLADKTAVVQALGGHSAPLVAALDGAFAPAIDATGKITNRVAAAAAFDDAYTATGGK